MRLRNPSVTGGDLPGVVFFAPLNGGSLHGWITGLAGMRDRFENVFLQWDRKRCRHRVSPKTTPARSPVIFPPLT